MSNDTKRKRRKPIRPRAASAARIDIRLAKGATPTPSERRLLGALRHALQPAVAALLDPRLSVGIDVLVTGGAEIRRLNAQHRRIARATDCLSFPQLSPAEVLPLWGVHPPRCFTGPRRTSLTAAQALRRPPTLAREPVPLGDIVLSLPTIRRQATRRDTTLREELQFVAVHSLLHLLGCDHDTPERRRDMWALSQTLLGLQA